MTSHPVIVDSLDLISGLLGRDPPGVPRSLEIMFLAVAPAGRHPATLGTLLLVAGHLAHLYQDAVETGREAATAIFRTV